MINQTPPTAVVSDAQVAKWEQITRDCLRKGGLDGPTFQYILGHKDLAGQLGQIFSELAAEYRQSKPLLERPPFASIQVGTFKAVDELRQALLDGGFHISDWASDLMGRPEFILVPEPTELKLYSATNEELGFPNGCTVAESFAALERIGAVKLPPEAGPQYRLQYPDQPMGEWRLMYMDPIAGSDGDLRVFDVGRHGGGLWLSGDCASPGRFCRGDRGWVFGRKS